MKREGWLIAIAVAVLCAGGVAVWWLQSPPAGEPASVHIGTSPVTIDEHNAPEVVYPTEKDAKKDLDASLDEYLGSVKQAYGKQTRDYLDAEEPVELDIPVPPVDPMELDAPDLMPPASDPAKRP